MMDSPRKGRHARSQAVGGSASHGVAFDRTGNFNAAAASAAALVPPSALSGLPVGVDPLTLDPDGAFIRFSVREVQAIEASLRTSCDTLTARLRLLVSERYRDMLGTANTLIDMSESSSNLVKQIDCVLDGLQDGGSGTTRESVKEQQMTDMHAADQSEVQVKQLFALAATTKLITEAPDEVWRAVETASKADNGKSLSQKHSDRHLDLCDLQAATTLRAAWIFTLAQASWSWLTSSAERPMPQSDAQQTFPYVAKQRASLQSMRPYIVRASMLGLSGWMTTNESRTPDRVSVSYLSTVTSLLSLALLEGASQQSARDTLLNQRRDTLAIRVKQSQASSSRAQGSEILSNIVRFVANTLLHALRAFVLPAPNDAKKTHLASLIEQLQSSEPLPASHETAKASMSDARHFPPSADSVLHTLPSAALLTEHLPYYVRSYTPRLEAEEDLNSLANSTVQALQRWTQSIDADFLSDLLPTFVERLSTIATIGHVQSAVWTTLDRCVAETRRICGQQGGRLAKMVEEELRSLARRIDDLLVDRLKAICQSYGNELSTVVVQGIQSALDSISRRESDAKSSADLAFASNEDDAIRFLFDTTANGSTDMSDASTVDGLERRLRARTQHVQDIVTLAEERVRSFADETRAYSKMIKHAEARSARKRGGDVDSSVHSDIRRSNGQAILASFELSLSTAKESIAKAMTRLSNECLNPEHLSMASCLFLAKLLSALCRSNAFDVLDVKAGTRAESVANDDLRFVEKLQSLQRMLLRAWSEKVVQKSMDAFVQRKRITNWTTIEQGEQDTLPPSPSAALLDALAVLAKGCQAVGVGYQSEATWLRTTIMHDFFLAWYQASPSTSSSLSKQEQLQRMFDVEVLRILVTHSESSRAHADEQDKSVAVDDALASAQKIDGMNFIEPSTWQQHLANQLPVALLRTRLLLAAVAVDETRLTNAIAKDSGMGTGITADRVRSSGDLVHKGTATAVPSLPLLRLVRRQRETVPRVQLANAT